MTQKVFVRGPSVGCLVSQKIIGWLNLQFNYFLNFTKESLILASSGEPFHATMDDGKKMNI